MFNISSVSVQYAGWRQSFISFLLGAFDPIPTSRVPLVPFESIAFHLHALRSKLAEHIKDLAVRIDAVSGCLYIPLCIQPILQPRLSRRPVVHGGVDFPRSSSEETK
jgi:hypothetical protein